MEITHDTVLEQGDKLAVATVLTVLNFVVYSVSQSSLPLFGTALIWGTVLIAGYVAGKVGDLPIMISELASLTLLFIVVSGWASPTYVLQSIVTLTLLFIAGYVGGSSFMRTRRSIEFPKTDIKSVLPVFLGSIGVMLIIASILWGLKELSPEYIPISKNYSNTVIYLCSGLINAFIISCSLSSKNTTYYTTVAVGGLIASLSYISFPLAACMISLEERPTIIIEKCVKLGTMIKTIKPGNMRSYGRALCYDLTPNENNHMIITGSTGTGKTTLVKNVLNQLITRRMNIVVLDYHGEYITLSDARILRPDRERINIFALMGKEPEIRSEELAEAISSAYRLGSVQRAALQQLLLHAYKVFGNVTPEELNELVNDELIHQTLGFSKDIIKSLVPYVRNVSGSKNITWLDPAELLEGTVVIDLSRLGSLPLQQVISESIIEILYHIRKQVPGTTLLVVEEAQRLVKKRTNTPIARVFREGRKFGLSVIAIYQDPLAIDPALINNSSALVSFQIPEENSSIYLARNIAGQTPRLLKKVKQTLVSLSKGKALVWHRSGGIYVIKILKIH